MCRVDLHVHTRRYSPCAEFLDPRELGAIMAEQQLDAVLLTEHDAQWGSEELDALRRACQPHRIFAGIELSARDGHVVAVGVRGELPIDKRRSVEDTTLLVAEAGGTSILVHPFRMRSAWGPIPPHGLGAVEVASTVTVDEAARAASALAVLWRLAAVAGSDAHAPDRVGTCWTWLPVMPRDEAELAQQIKSGQGVAWSQALDGERA